LSTSRQQFPLALRLHELRVNGGGRRCGQSLRNGVGDPVSMCGRLASMRAFSSTIVLLSNFPLASSSRIHFVRSLTDELTPPAGASVSGSRWNFCTHLPSTSTCPSALLARPIKSECRELVAIIPSGL